MNNSGTVNVTAADSVAAGNVHVAFFAISGQAPTTLALVRSVAVNNSTGIVAASANAVLTIAQSEVTGNTNGWQVGGGGVIQSHGDNYFNGNGSNSGNLTPIIKQ
jgi:hypothetical protein